MAARSPSRGVVDTSVLVAGIAGFKSQIAALKNPSARLVSEEILEEYKKVLGRLGVRRNLVGNIVNLLREEAKFLDVPVTVDVSPDPGDNPFCACAEAGNAAFIVTLNPKDFPQSKLRARVISPGSPLPTTAPRRLRLSP